MPQVLSQTLPPPQASAFDSQAAAIIAQHQREAPVNVAMIANALGVNVYAQDLGKNVSGILRRDQLLGGSSGYVILVHEKHNVNRQRFTAAHELGHFLLHRDRVNDRGTIEEDEFYRAFSGPLETEANQFAADLLMPWSLLNSLRESGITDFPTMAQRLAVSKQALAIRLGLPYDKNWE